MKDGFIVDSYEVKIATVSRYALHTMNLFISVIRVKLVKNQCQQRMYSSIFSHIKASENLLLVAQTM